MKTKEDIKAAMIMIDVMYSSKSITYEEWFRFDKEIYSEFPEYYIYGFAKGIV